MLKPMKRNHAVICLLLIMAITISAAGCNQQSPVSADKFEIATEEISWAIEDTTVYATITRPDVEGVYPAVILVAGSGPTDRNWNSPLLPGTNGSGRLLAEALAREGFVTLRYDKRFTGPHAEENIPLLIGRISLKSHVDEIAGGVETLLNRPDVDPERIFTLANSEGTIHAMNYQLEREPGLAGLVLAAPPGRSLAELMRSQLAAQVENIPEGDEIMAGYDRLMEDFLAGKTVVPDPDLPDGVNNLVISLQQPANLPFTREIQDIDPVQLLERIAVPVLVVIGQKDIQVDWQVDGELLEAVANASPEVTFIYPEDADHVLKYEPKSRAELSAADALNYNASGRMLDPELLRAILDWLNEAGR